MADFTPLDNVIWHALGSSHASLARSRGWARRYSPAVSPLAGLQEPAAEAFADLAALIEHDAHVALFTIAALDVPNEHWGVARTRWIDQMVCPRLLQKPTVSEPILPLGDADVPEMLALTAATEPGPFLAETIRMGRYFGIRSADGKLAAMAGERLKLAAFAEISAVCTDPAFRGRGYGGALVAYLAGLIERDGKVPFLHVKNENRAKRLYEQLGFHVRRPIQLTVLVRQ